MKRNKELNIMQHMLSNPLSEKHRYIEFIIGNPHTVGNGNKRRECAYLERKALAIQWKTKTELIQMLIIWNSNAFININYHLKPSEIWPVIRLIKKALSFTNKK